MALSSDLKPLGTPPAPFQLPDVVSGKTVSLQDFAGEKALLVMFTCSHCPYVVHVRPQLVRMGKDYAGKGLGIVAISSNDAKTYPDDAPKKLKKMAEQDGFPFPLCYDESQDVARAYGAVCTPDFFLFGPGPERGLVYRGQMDDTRPNGPAATGADLRAAIDAILEGRPVNPDQKPSVGCGIKWKR
jgi:peroxiredoxin